jgi:hypothetical protein
MVSVSPRLRDSLDYEDPEETDPRFTLGFRSLSLASEEYAHFEQFDDHRPSSGHQDALNTRKRRRQRDSDRMLKHAVPFQYRTTADGDVFRVAILLPGRGTAPIQCRLEWENSRKPRHEYRCLSYCWETTERTAAILCDGYRFAVTQNLYSAMHCLRSATTDVRIWIDQLCINQDDHEERSQQVSIMVRQ